MTKDTQPLGLGGVADVCGIVALALALGIGRQLLLLAIVFCAGLLTRPRVERVARGLFGGLGGGCGGSG